MSTARNFILFCLLAIVQEKLARIINGGNADIENRPFQVSLQSSFNSGHFCGGSILNENYVITAAHCTKLDWITLQPEQIQVAVGSIMRSRPLALHTVISIKRHENFILNNDSAINDIALLKVTPPFKYNDKISPVTLPKPHLVIPPNTKAVVSGWGTLTYPNLTMPEIMKTATVSIVNQEYCREAYKATNQTVYSVHLCTHNVSDVRKGACRGDSGGPLTINGSTLVGIISWSRKDQGCASPRFPNVYTRISEFIDWIKKNAV